MNDKPLGLLMADQIQAIAARHERLLRRASDQPASDDECEAALEAATSCACGDPAAVRCCRCHAPVCADVEGMCQDELESIVCPSCVKAKAVAMGLAKP